MATHSLTNAPLWSTVLVLPATTGVGNAAAATSALSCSTNDRDRNEFPFFPVALRVVDSLLGQESHDDCEFVTAEDSPSPR